MSKHSIKDIVDAMGGRSEVARRFELTYDTVLKWSVNGIPPKHWARIVKETEFDYSDLEPHHPDNFRGDPCKEQSEEPA